MVESHLGGVVSEEGKVWGGAGKLELVFKLPSQSEPGPGEHLLSLGQLLKNSPEEFNSPER